MARNLRIGLVQHRCGDEPADNLARALAGIREAAERGAKLVCLQELFRSTYFCQTEDPEFFAKLVNDSIRVQYQLPRLTLLG